MSQHDMNIDNGPGLAVRTDMNAAIQALASNNSGATEPLVTYAGQFWLDTTTAPNGTVRMRNLSNTGWTKLFDVKDPTTTPINPPSLLLTEQATPPATIADQLALYSKDVAGVTKLFMRGPSNGAEVEIGGSFLSWPAGMGIDWWGPAEPPGARFCYGQSLLVASFPALFAALQYAFGGSGANFNLPDCRGRVLAGKDDMGGTSANRLTGTIQNPDGDVLGAAGGAEGTTLASGHMPSHSHAPTFAGSTIFSNGGGGGYFINLASTGTGGAWSTTTAGGGAAHGNLQPTIICNKLITTGGVA